jgi:subtilisin-like proprotein convertase family protein
VNTASTCGRQPAKSRRRFAFLLSLLLLAFTTSNASAVLIVTTSGSTLSRFDSASPDMVSSVLISGMQSGETLIGIDFRPATGELYGIGAANRVYRLDYTTGVATQVGAPAGFNISGTAFGVDFNPLPDRIRLVSNTEQNLRINPTDATLTATDTPLNPAGNIVAVAYSNNVAGAPNTTLYGIDSASGQLVRIGGPNGTPSPNSGQITNIGSLGLGTNLNENIGFDIAPNGTAYASITTQNLSRVYTINLTSRRSRLPSGANGGLIGNGSNPYRGLTVGPTVFSNASLIRLPSVGNSTGTADPYPSTINVSGLTGGIVKVAVRIKNFQHTRPNDIDMLLVAPSGEKMVIWSDVGGTTSTCSGQCNNSNIASQGVTITVDDAAAFSLPTGASPPLASGSFKPANIDSAGADFFAAPAPSPPYAQPAPVGSATLASAFNGINPNGTWSLYISDDQSGETGRISEGWDLEITDAPCTLTCRADITAIASPGQCGPRNHLLHARARRRVRRGHLLEAVRVILPVGTTVVNVSTSSGSQCSFNVTVTDQQVPAITCNSDITVQAPSGQNSAVVEFPPAMVADNCAGATSVYDPPSGSSFPIGTTTVTGTSTDQAVTR